MKREDLRNFSRTELEDIFINLVNEMRATGEEHRSNNMKTDIDYYYQIYGSALLVRANRMRTLVYVKNNPTVEGIKPYDFDEFDDLGSLLYW